MTRDELVVYTKNLIDEVSPINGFGQDINEEDIKITDFEGDKPIDDFIEALLDESGDEAQLLAPTHMVGYVSANMSDMSVISDYERRSFVGEFEKPNTFLKLARARLGSWERSVTYTLKEGEVGSDIQSNIYLRGGVAKPKIVEERDYLYLYPAFEEDITDTSSKIEYVARVSAERVSTGLQNILCWLCAGRVYGRVGNPSAEKECREMASALLKELERKII